MESNFSPVPSFWHEKLSIYPHPHFLIASFCSVAILLHRVHIGCSRNTAGFTCDLTTQVKDSIDQNGVFALLWQQANLHHNTTLYKCFTNVKKQNQPSTTTRDGCSSNGMLYATTARAAAQHPHQDELSTELHVTTTPTSTTITTMFWSMASAKTLF